MAETSHEPSVQELLTANYAAHRNERHHAPVVVWEKLYAHVIKGGMLVYEERVFTDDGETVGTLDLLSVCVAPGLYVWSLACPTSPLLLADLMALCKLKGFEVQDITSTRLYHFVRQHPFRLLVDLLPTNTQR